MNLDVVREIGIILFLLRQRDRVLFDGWGEGGQIFSQREACISYLSLLVNQELFKNFAVGDGDFELFKVKL